MTAVVVPVTFQRQQSGPKVQLSYKEFKAQVAPLDLIGIHGARPASYVIEAVEYFGFGEGKYTHVGVVVTTDIVEIKNARAGELYLWESIPMAQKGEPSNIETGHHSEGVQIRRLEDVFQEHHKAFGWARLHQGHNVWAQSAKNPVKRSVIRSALTALLDKVRGAPFDFNPVHALSSLLSDESALGDGQLAPHMSSPAVPPSLPSKFFCSELATIIYQTVGIIPVKVRAGGVAPIELLGLAKVSQGSYFEPPIQVVHDPTMPGIVALPIENKNEAPVEELAIAHRNRTCPRHETPDGDFETYSVFGDDMPTDKMGIFGVGIQQYFILLRKLGFFFLFLSIIVLPIIGFNVLASLGYVVNANALPSAVANSTTVTGFSVFSRLSLAGVATATSPLNGAGVTLSITIPLASTYSVVVDRELIGFVYACYDVFGCLAFFLFIWRVRVALSDEVMLEDTIEREQAQLKLALAQADGEDMSAEKARALSRMSKAAAEATKRALIKSERDFTIKVDAGTWLGAFPVEATNRKELADFFDQCSDGPGSVRDVVVVFNDGDLLELYSERGALKLKRSAAKARNYSDEVADIDEKIGLLDDRINRVRQELNLEPICAYVTFESDYTRNSLLRRYPSAWWWRLLCCCCANDKYKFLNEYIFKLSEATDSSNIIFTNLAYSRQSKFLRRAFTLLITIIALAVSFAVVFVASYVKSKVPQTENCVSSISLNQTTSSDQLLSCYCKQTLQSGNIDISFFTSGPCVTWFQQYSLSLALLYGSSVIIAIVNRILLWLIQKLVMFEKHTSVTSEQTAVMMKMFVALFINTAFLNLLVSSQFSDFGFTLFAGSYADFTPSWYAAVGEQLTITMFLNIVNPHLIDTMLIPVSWCLRKYKGRKCATQKEMNAVYDGEPYFLAPRYAALMNTVFVTFLFSSGIPILIPAAMLCFFVSFWCERALLFNEHRTPPKFDRSLLDTALSILPWCIFFHSLFATWMYSSPTIFAGYSIGSVINSLGSSVASIYSNGVATLSANASFSWSRILNWNSFPNFIIAVLMIALTLVSFVVQRLLLCRSDERDSAKVSPALESPRLQDGVAAAADQVAVHSYSEAARVFAMSTYRISDQENYKNAFLKTDSFKQMKPTNDIGQDDGWTK